MTRKTGLIAFLTLACDLLIVWVAAAQPGANQAVAEITIIVAADAEIFFDGEPTTQKGTERCYVTPPLVVGKKYSYEVLARWQEGGKAVKQTRTVQVAAASKLVITFTGGAANQGAPQAGNTSVDDVGIEGPAKFAATDPESQLAHQRAVEAVLWSMPAMSDVYFRQSLFRDFGMKPGDVLVMSKPLVARHEVLTANNQVNYCGMAYDLTHGPLVVVIPPSESACAIIGEICDNWQAPITMVGVEGPDAGKGGKYLLLPPGHKGDVPAGYVPVRLEGYRGTMVYRPVIVGKGTMEDAVALARQTQTYPLSEAAKPPPTRVVDGWSKPMHSLPVYDVSWFRNLAEFVNGEPIRERDKVMVGMLSSLGIEKGKPFNPDEKTTKILDSAVKDAYRIMQHGWTTPGQALTAWWPDRHWMNMNPAMMKLMGAGWSFETPDGLFTYQRAITPFFWANYLPVKLGGQQLYLMGLRDSSDKPLSGKGRYRLRIPPDVPVDKFWSVIVYSQKTKSFIPNPLDRAGLDSYEKAKLKTNRDGSVDIYFGDSAPAGSEDNWLPSAGEDFFLIFRLYGPQKSVYDKTWKLPDVELFNKANWPPCRHRCHVSVRHADLDSRLSVFCSGSQDRRAHLNAANLLRSHRGHIDRRANINLCNLLRPRLTSARSALPPICFGCVANTIMWRPAGFLGPQRELTRVNAT
jgi:uncharacterized protein (TIGR03000 family)